MAKQSHAHRVPEPDAIACECGRKFATDDEWRAHYERETSDAEQRKAEARLSSADEHKVAEAAAESNGD